MVCRLLYLQTRDPLLLLLLFFLFFLFFSFFTYIYMCYIIHPFFSLVVIVADEHLKVIFINVILIFAET